MGLAQQRDDPPKKAMGLGTHMLNQMNYGVAAEPPYSRARTHR